MALEILFTMQLILKLKISIGGLKDCEKIPPKIYREGPLGLETSFC